MASYDKVKEWLQQYVHTTITKSQPEVFGEMYAILQLHPRYNDWVSQRPEHFRITRSPKKKALQVYVKFENLKRERLVSWVDCTDHYRPKVNEQENRLTQAMRSTVGWQIGQWRTFNNPRKCALCDSWNNIEVDHHPKKFAEIKKEFLENLVKPAPEKFFWDSKNGRFHFEKADKEFQDQWDHFHLLQAKYRYLCSTCNQKSH